VSDVMWIVVKLAVHEIHTISLVVVVVVVVFA
jgi:hypothetical protein